MRKEKEKNEICSISSDMCVALLDDLRKSIKEFDKHRFPLICKTIPTENMNKGCMAAMTDIEYRCRSLNIIKGFGGENLQFINKYLVYNTVNDKPMNMGASILKFKIDKMNKVKCDTHEISPEILMEQIYIHKIVDPSDNKNITYWSNMQDCISYCTSSIGRNKTVFVIDLSCSCSPNEQNPIGLFESS